MCKLAWISNPHVLFPCKGRMCGGSGVGVKSFCAYRKHVSGKRVLCTRITLLVLNRQHHVISLRERCVCEWIGWSSDVYCSWSSIYIGTDYWIERARWMSVILLLVSREKLKGLDELDRGILQRPDQKGLIITRTVCLNNKTNVTFLPLFILG